MIELAPWNCPFCKIASGEGTPPKRLMHYPGVVAFEPLNPVTRGHKLFVPKRHVRDAKESPEVLGNVMTVAAYHAATAGNDFNLIVNNGDWATQTVSHLHVHYVPRQQGDNLHLPWTNQVKEQG